MSFKAEPSDNVENEANFVIVDYLCLYFVDTSCRSRLATLNEKLTQLERRVEYIEARVRDSFCILSLDIEWEQTFI